MLNMIWHLLRTFYWLGVLVAVPFFLIALTQFGSHDREMWRALVLFCLCYFFLGYFGLKALRNFLRARLMNRVVYHMESTGFAPMWEAVGVLYNRYLGFDSDQQKILYIDVNTGTEQFLDFDNINSWELEERTHYPALIRLLTRIPSIPLIRVQVKRQKADEWRANLGMIFG